ncbi:CYTH domain-containing protein [Candidatus Woesearchaeota archaeon]|nr:CYTH domain-containing protein [Candidatus Woesearchaeota archaeon]
MTKDYQELEVKILEIDVVAMQQKLESLGAVRHYDGQVLGSIWDYADGRLAAEGKQLRVRTLGDKVEFCLKEGLVKQVVKTASEYEIAFGAGQLESLKKILLALGLQETRAINKHRVEYLLGNCKIALDQDPRAPPWMEIEAPSAQHIEALLPKLGYTMADAKPWTTWDVLRHYGKA